MGLAGEPEFQSLVNRVEAVEHTLAQPRPPKGDGMDPQWLTEQFLKGRRFALWLFMIGMGALIYGYVSLSGSIHALDTATSQAFQELKPQLASLQTSVDGLAGTVQKLDGSVRVLGERMSFMEGSQQKQQPSPPADS